MEFRRDNREDSKERIEEIESMIKKIEDVWKKNPTLRFGQLVENIHSGNDLFTIEDCNFLTCIKDFETKNP